MMSKIVIEVCAGTHCTLMGAMDIINAVDGLKDIHQEIYPDCELEVVPVSCSQACDNGPMAPVVFINGEKLLQTDSESVMERILAIAADSCQAR